MKTCRLCEVEKSLENFSPHISSRLGVSNTCKCCAALLAKKYRADNPGMAAKRQKEYRLKNPEKIIKANKERWKDPFKRQKLLDNLDKWKKDNPDHYKKWYWSRPEIREKKLNYRKTWLKNNPEYNEKNAEIQRKKHPEKHKARSVLRKAVYENKIIKPKMCECCMNESNRIEGHHKDYSQPLEVNWLCVKCHKQLHMNEDSHGSQKF